MKISKIEINDFRGFPGPESYVFDLAGGKNLLVYGENGSGKSSLYRALVEFFNLGAAAPTFESHRNIFSSNPPSNSGHVTLELVGGARHTWTCGGTRPSRDMTLAPREREGLIDAARRAALLEYRSLLRTNFGPDDIRGRLFALAVDTLLANVPVATAGGTQKTVRQLWDALKASVPMRHSQPQLHRVAEAEIAFNDGVRGILPDVETKTADFLRSFADRTLGVRIALPGVRYNHAPARRDRAIVDRYLDVEVSLRGVVLPQWSSFLNEARLSALAISLYLASAVLNNPTGHLAGGRTPLRILALDDVLIGLDLTHRLPMLQVIEDHFVDYQVILLTYDRVWFELAQLAFRHRERWTTCELHSRPHDSGSSIFDKPAITCRISDAVQYHLAQAGNFLDNAHDPRTAAFHARVAFEAKLKQHCKRRKIPLPYDPEERNLNTEVFLSAIEQSLTSKGTAPLCVWTIHRVKLFRRGVLNPLAHAHSITITESEVRAALLAVKDLTFHDPPGARTTFIKEAAARVNAPPANDVDRLDAACWLRTAFEVDLRRLLSKLRGRLAFRYDWTTIALDELWQAAKEAMRGKNPVSASAVIANVEAHRHLLLDEWSYQNVSRLTVQQLQDALIAIQDTSKPELRTKLVPFK